MSTFRETYPPRWRFGFVRDALKLLEGAPRVSQRRRTEIMRDALEHLDSLEATLLPAIPSIEEFQRAALAPSGEGTL